MKKLLVITIIFILLVSITYAKLSDDTLKEVEKLRWKHNVYTLTGSDITLDWTQYYSWTMYFEEGKLFIETQDSKWFIEMEEVRD